VAGTVTGLAEPLGASSQLAGARLSLYCRRKPGESAGVQEMVAKPGAAGTMRSSGPTAKT